MLGRLPRFARLSVVAAFLLLLPLAIVPFTAPSTETQATIHADEARHAAAVHRERAEVVARWIRDGEIHRANAELATLLAPEFLSAGYAILLDAVEDHLRSSATREGLELYAMLLARTVRQGEKSRELELHLRTLPYRALTMGGKELFARIADPLLRYEHLARYTCEAGFEMDTTLALAGYYVLFERWNDALAAVEAVLASESLRKERLEVRLKPARLLARIAGASRLPAARQALDGFLAAFAAELGPESEQAAQVRQWLDGVARFYAPPGALDRGASRIARAVEPTIIEREQILYRLDLARALRDEANLRAGALRAEYVPSERERGRQFFVIGWGAARLGEAAELRAVQTRLAEDAGSRKSRGYLALLRGAQELANGLAATGAERIRATLDDYPGLLPRDEEAAFREAARRGRLPPVAHRGHVLFTRGKIWSDLEARADLDRARERLRRELGGPADLAYLSFLDALAEYRDSAVESARERLVDLLDRPLPADLSRGEVAALLVLIEERRTEIERVDSRRRQAGEALAALRLTEGQPEAKLARILQWQLATDAGGERFILGADGSTALERIEKSLDEPWLAFDLEEKLLEIQEDLLGLAHRLRDAGDLAGAFATLARARKLVRNVPRYRYEEALLLEREALTLDPSREAEARDKWRAAGEAYVDAAAGSFGNGEWMLEATHAFTFAGDFERAEFASNRYAPSVLRGATTEARYWRALLQRIEIARERGRVSDAARLAADNLDRLEAGVHRHELLLERGRCLEMLDKESDALLDYDAIYAELDPSSASWLEAMLRKARILHRRAQRSVSAADLATARGAALAAWEELAAWLPEDAGTRRLEADYYAGDACLDERNYARARVHFGRVVTGALALESSPLPAAERERVAMFQEKAAYAQPDAHFLEGEFDVAARGYKEAVGRHPRSAQAPYGYYQIGECESRMQRREEAIRFYQLGERKVAELSDEILAELPPGRGKDFWANTFREKIRAHARN